MPNWFTSRVLAGLVMLWLGLLTCGQALAEQPFGITVANVTESRLTICWTTQQPVIGSISYGNSSDNLDQIALDDRGCVFLGTTHVVTLDGLQADSPVFFKVHSDDEIFDDSGIPFLAETGSVLSLPPVPTSTVFGNVFAADCSSFLRDFFLLVSIEDHDGLGSTGESATYAYVPDLDANLEGRWLMSLDLIRTQDQSGYYSFSSQDDNLSVTLIGGPAFWTNTSFPIAQKGFGSANQSWEAPSICAHSATSLSSTGVFAGQGSIQGCPDLPCGELLFGSTVNLGNKLTDYSACGVSDLDGGEYEFFFSPTDPGVFEFTVSATEAQDPLYIIVTDVTSGDCIASTSSVTGPNTIRNVELSPGTYGVLVDSAKDAGRRFSVEVACDIFTPTPTPTETPIPTETPTPTESPIPTETSTPTMQPFTATPEATNTPVSTATPTTEPIATATPTEVPSNTPPPTSTDLPTSTPTPAPSETPTPTFTASPSPSPTLTATTAPTNTPRTHQYDSTHKHAAPDEFADAN